MFGIEISPSWTDRDQDIADRMLTEPGFSPADYMAAHRSKVPIAPFEESYRNTDQHPSLWEYALVCPVCGSEDVEDECIDDYGGTSSGWTSCKFCGYSTSWADLSAVI